MITSDFMGGELPAPEARRGSFETPQATCHYYGLVRQNDMPLKSVVYAIAGNPLLSQQMAERAYQKGGQAVGALDPALLCEVVEYSPREKSPEAWFDSVELLGGLGVKSAETILTAFSQSRNIQRLQERLDALKRSQADGHFNGQGEFCFSLIYR